MLYDRMRKELKKLDEKISGLQEELMLLPPGKLICAKNGKYYKWYQSFGNSISYIPKSDLALAQKLAQKKYLFLQQKDFMQEKKAVETYLKIHKEPAQAAWLLEHTSPYQKLLKPYFSAYSQKLSEWGNSPYETNTIFPEQRKYESSSGHMLRSKSEVIIDIGLYTNKIPFRYECILSLDNKSLYPDFTIRHPETGEFFYWEHFGMMDDPQYSKNAFQKLQLYNSHGIFPSVNLITTYETKEHPLSAEYVQTLIDYYFL